MADLGVATESAGQQESSVRLPRFQLLGRTGRFWISLIVGLLVVCASPFLAQSSNISDTEVALFYYVVDNVVFVVYLVLTYIHFRSEPATRIRARATARHGWFRMVRSILLWACFAFGQLYSVVDDLRHVTDYAPDASGQPES